MIVLKKQLLVIIAALIVPTSLGSICFPEMRQFVLYSVCPSLFVAALALAGHRFLHQRWLWVLLIAGTAAIHTGSFLTQKIIFEPDSYGYLAHAADFAAGKGFPDMIFRAPLYPFIAGILYALGAKTAQPLVILQHLLLIAALPLIYQIARHCSCSRETSFTAAVLTACNSIALQMTERVMTEIPYLFLSLVAVRLALAAFHHPGVTRAIASGIAFGCTLHLRPLLLPVFMFLLVLQAFQKKRNGLLCAVIAGTVCLAAIVPWSLRNVAAHGVFAMDASLGTNAFTKALSFGLIDRTGTAYASIAQPFENILQETGLAGKPPPVHPEDDWALNRVPHLLLDTLRATRGLGYARASGLLKDAAFEGFIRYPQLYVRSVFKTFSTLLFEHRELYPDLTWVVPLNPDGIMGRFARGIVWIPGFAFILFPLLAVVYRRRPLFLLPWIIILLGYGATAALQVGFTRYTVPWIPYMAICWAALLCEPFTRWQKRKA